MVLCLDIMEYGMIKVSDTHDTGDPSVCSALCMKLLVITITINKLSLEIEHKT